MEKALNELSDDVDLLKSLLADQALKLDESEAHKQRLLARNQQLESRVLTLQEQLNLALARRYAASSEKLSPDQYRLFDEAEADTGAEPEAEEITVPAHTRKKRGRKKLPEVLPRVDVVHELSGDELICPHDGATLAEIGAVTSEQLDIVPAKIQVIRHIRKQYACDCGQCIKTATFYPNSRFPRVWHRQACWPISRSRSIRMLCPCIGKKPSCGVLVSISPVPRWPTG